MCASRRCGRPAATCFMISGCQPACLPIGKNTALVHWSASALSTAGVCPGHGPSSNVRTTSWSLQEIVGLEMLEAEAGAAGGVNLDDARNAERVRIVALGVAAAGAARRRAPSGGRWGWAAPGGGGRRHRDRKERSPKHCASRSPYEEVSIFVSTIHRGFELPSQRRPRYRRNAGIILV